MIPILIKKFGNCPLSVARGWPPGGIPLRAVFCFCPPPFHGGQESGTRPGFKRTGKTCAVRIGKPAVRWPGGRMGAWDWDYEVNVITVERTQEFQAEGDSARRDCRNRLVSGHGSPVPSFRHLSGNTIFYSISTACISGEGGAQREDYPAKVTPPLYNLVPRPRRGLQGADLHRPADTAKYP